jgi:peptidyl-Lys metalloendopeptidase
MQTTRHLIAIILSLGVFAYVLSACDSAMIEGLPVSTDLRADLVARQAAYRAGDPVLVDVTITNVSASNIKLLSWMLPADDLEEPLFVVTRDGQGAEFVGPRYKRPEPVDADFVRLDAGAKLTRQVDLAQFYDLSQTGEHEIQLVVGDYALRPFEGAATVVASNAVRVWIEGRAAAAGELSAPESVADSLAFSRCTTTQQSIITQAVANAKPYSHRALSYLRGHLPGSLYTTWFGNLSGGLIIAENHFTAIAGAFDSKQISFDCGCQNRKSYAFVIPNKPYKIHLCDPFWQAPLTGTNSKAGTLVHEMSHFTVVAGTDDYVYGQPACRRLAALHPRAALDNADSHEYFAENAPALKDEVPEPTDPPTPTDPPQVTETNTFITLGEVLNGQPGFVSVSGNVLGTNGVSVSGTVNVNFDKVVNGAWMYMNTAQRTLVNGSYDVAYWRVGVGQWRVRAVFPQQGDYVSSVSNYHPFEVKSGYRLVNRHSDKCMSLSGNNGGNGMAILQWDCSGNPSPGDGQVFTLYPLGGGDFNIVINSTGKCVDVAGVSQADGAYVQQWDCLGPGQRNQVWHVIPIAGQPPYVAFQAQHSGKCADVLGASTGNGARIGQWGCWWGGNQQWTLQGIN